MPHAAFSSLDFYEKDSRVKINLSWALAHSCLLSPTSLLSALLVSRSCGALCLLRFNR